ncbi:hypothetical protein ABZZ79_35605 [Streptomyces sp. NPDC006458]|uniref:hypothetical protein n=1 Tax=Streptomyces sp. NPDC006458 TaxID=3154302 RepID=UPI00339EEE33
MAGDLERNVKEQERLSGEIDALQTQLAALRSAHAILVNLQTVLTDDRQKVTPASPEPNAKVPTPRGGAASAPAVTERKKKQAPATPRKRTASNTTPKTKAAPNTKASTTTKSAAPTSDTPSAAPKLVDLVRDHLTAQSEPRSAAEVTAALEQSQPERSIKTTVVRSTLEGLVARNQAQRSKQGSSVYYTASDTADAAVSAEQATQDEQAAQQAD